MENNSAGRNRRHNARTWMNRPGRVRIGDGPESYTQVVDISPQGAAMYCSTPLSPGTDVEVRFHLNMNPRTVWLTLNARVERTYERGDSHLVRVLFVNPTLQEIETITQFAKQKTQKIE
jgi:PilZ domain-containing protein